MLHDYRTWDLDPQTRAMLDYAAKLTRTPGDMTKSDVQKLRDTGLGDEQILSAALVACLFSFMTRLADGLGVDITDSRSQFRQMAGYPRTTPRRRRATSGRIHFR